jgi:hypothetical protein
MLSSSHSLLEALVCIYLQRLLLSCFPLDQHRLNGVLGPSQDTCGCITQRFSVAREYHFFTVTFMLGS